MTEKLTTAQTRVLLQMLEMEGETGNRWSRPADVADRLGHEGRGRAAVSASLRRLEKRKLVQSAHDVHGPTVALTQAGRDRGQAIVAPQLPPVAIRLDESGYVDEVAIAGGGVHLEMMDHAQALLVGPGGLMVGVAAEVRRLRSPVLRLWVYQEGEAAQVEGRQVVPPDQPALPLDGGLFP